jgi:anti-anti-sigma factor
MTRARSVPTLPIGPSAAAAPFEAVTRVRAGVAVITLSGTLDAAALPACRHAVDAAVKVRTSRVVLDLNGVTFGDASAGVLRLIRQSLARRGATLSIVAASHEATTWLQEADPESAYRVLPTVPLAVGVAATTLPRQYSVR